MQGTMMNYPLTLVHFLERAGKVFPESEVVSRLPDHSLHRYVAAPASPRSSYVNSSPADLPSVQFERLGPHFGFTSLVTPKVPER